MTFDELPEEWQATIKGLHGELRALRKGPQLAPDELPKSWQFQFSRLRRDIARTRIQRNEAREEVKRLRAELEAARNA